MYSILQIILKRPKNFAGGQLMKKEDIQKIAFQIIAYAGSAFDYFNQAIDLASKNNIIEAEEKIRSGNEELNRAHNAQTSILACEANNEDIPYSIIMVHAQDHLTMALFTERMAKHFINIWKEKGC